MDSTGEGQDDGSARRQRFGRWEVTEHRRSILNCSWHEKGRTWLRFHSQDPTRACIFRHRQQARCINQTFVFPSINLWSVCLYLRLCSNSGHAAKISMAPGAPLDQSFSYPSDSAYQLISIKRAAFVQTMISRSWPFEIFPLSLPSSVISGVSWYLEQIHLGGPLETFTFSTSAASCDQFNSTIAQ